MTCDRAIIYRQEGTSPCYPQEINAEDCELTCSSRARFNAIVIPIAADGSLNTIEDGYVRYWSRDWKDKVCKFAEENRGNLAEAKGKYILHFTFTRGSNYNSLYVIGIPVKPLKSGVLQYAWVESVLESLRKDIQVGLHGLDSMAIANLIQSREDKRIEWPVVKGIIEKVFGGWSGKLYVYPPVSEPGNEGRTEDERLAEA